MVIRKLIFVMGLLMAFAYVGCGKEDPAERAGEKVEGAIEKVGEKAEESNEGVREKSKRAENKAEKNANVPDEVMIDNEGYTDDKKGPVKLSHKKHATTEGVYCADCHHDYKDGKNIWKEGDPIKRCVECHDPKEKRGDVAKLNIAYHKNCKDCHKERVKDDHKAPFKKCKGCHEEKSN